MERKMREWIAGVNVSGANARKMESVDVMFHLANIASSSESQNPEWIMAFKSLEDFWNAYGHGFPPDQKRGVRRSIDWFVEHIAQPQRMLEGDPNSKDPYRFRLETYFPEGTWILMPEKERENEDFHYVDADVIKEVVALLESDYVHPDYTHASGSATLPAIAAHGAILSSTEAMNREQDILTGEQGTGSGIFSGRGSVYVDRRGPRYGYHTLRWFNEFAVTFGINKERHEALQQFRYSDGSLMKDLGSEGTVVGPSVSLEAVDVVYYWKKYEKEMRTWAEVSVPHARPVSLEADKVLYTYRMMIKEEAKKNGRSEKDEWKALLEE